MAYVGGGSTRAPGTVASFIEQSENFQGSEIVLIDLNAERLELVKTIASKMARNKGMDLTITTTTDRRAGLTDCDAVLTSFRPGGFEARYLDESIPLKHGLIGQETQGPGGFFMALRSINVMQGIVREMEQVCPRARLFNYTNPVNIVAEAITHHSSIPCVSLCEGPLYTPPQVAVAAGLDPSKADATLIGLNHGSWSIRQAYDGQDMIPVLRDAWERRKDDPALSSHDRRVLELAVNMDSLPNDYFLYYYYKDEILAELKAKPTTRSQDIMASVPDYWTHYREQAAKDAPVLDPKRSRGGINELELALDVMDAVFNDRKEVWPVNVPNRGAIADFPDDLVVEVPGFVDKSGVFPVTQGHMPQQVVGLVKMLGEYQALTAEAAWSGTRIDAIRALATNPLVMSLRKATDLYDEMAAAHSQYLPERLLA
ncbi:MAG: glycoside hydrolase family 4 [Chloroflexi bacterium]|nr:glycoside hydrolase family 4 [Chloroflexota bacterium]